MTTSTGDKLSPTDLIALAKQAGMKTSSTLPDVYLFNPTTLQAFADLIRKDEREQCAVVCEKLTARKRWVRAGTNGVAVPECELAAAIRARTTT